MSLEPMPIFWNSGRTPTGASPAATKSWGASQIVTGEKRIGPTSCQSSTATSARMTLLARRSISTSLASLERPKAASCTCRIAAASSGLSLRISITLACLSKQQISDLFVRHEFPVNTFFNRPGNQAVDHTTAETGCGDKKQLQQQAGNIRGLVFQEGFDPQEQDCPSQENEQPTAEELYAIPQHKMRQAFRAYLFPLGDVTGCPVKILFEHDVPYQKPAVPAQGRETCASKSSTIFSGVTGSRLSWKCSTLNTGMSIRKPNMSMPAPTLWSLPIALPICVMICLMSESRTTLPRGSASHSRKVDSGFSRLGRSRVDCSVTVWVQRMSVAEAPISRSNWPSSVIHWL